MKEEKAAASEEKRVVCFMLRLGKEDRRERRTPLLCCKQ
jgi:hypothetical protein